jgi:anti-sigma factor ChrR (cupin superfamily)
METVMLRCKDVSTLIATDGLDRAPWPRRVAVALHLMMCRHCRRFARNIKALKRATRAIGKAFEAEVPADLEQKLRRRLEVQPKRPAPNPNRNHV